METVVINSREEAEAGEEKIAAWTKDITCGPIFADENYDTGFFLLSIPEVIEYCLKKQPEITPQDQENLALLKAIWAWDNKELEELLGEKLTVMVDAIEKRILLHDSWITEKDIIASTPAQNARVEAIMYAVIKLSQVFFNSTQKPVFIAKVFSRLTSISPYLQLLRAPYV